MEVALKKPWLLNFPPIDNYFDKNYFQRFCGYMNVFEDFVFLNKTAGLLQLALFFSTMLIMNCSSGSDAIFELVHNIFFSSPFRIKTAKNFSKFAFRKQLVKFCLMTFTYTANRSIFLVPILLSQRFGRPFYLVLNSLFHFSGNVRPRKTKPNQVFVKKLHFFSEKKKVVLCSF